jgi:hypothetical protein
VGGGVQLGPLGMSAPNWPTVPVPGDYDGEFGEMMIGSGNQSTWRKPAPVPLCPPQTPHDLTGRKPGPAAIGSLQLTIWAVVWPARPIVTYAATVWWSGVKLRTNRAELSKLQRMPCLSITWTIRTAPTAAIEVLLGLPPLNLQLEAENQSRNL